MQLTIEIPNQPLYDKIIWFLSKFKDDGLEIVKSTQNNDTVKSINSIEHFKTLQGVGKELYRDIDTDKYMKDLRDEW